jgi:putative ATPase
MEYFAQKYRPRTFDDVVGQSHLVSANSSLRKMVESGNIFNMIFYGPPGTGKSTLANVIALTTHRKFVKMNAVDLSVKDIKEELQGNDNFILMIDEIHLLNKKQQQSLLEATESGQVSLIGILSENPYFCLHNALLSRSIVFQFYPLQISDIESRLNTVCEMLKNEYETKNISIEDGLLETIARRTNGDVRSALNVLQLVFTKNLSPFSDNICMNVSDLEDISLQSYHDRDGDNHYNTLSAFHKSLRGSDENAAIYYLAKLIKGNDLQGIIRRLLCVATEDVGMANPDAITVVKACVDSALQLGFPEARIPLAQATIYLAKQPKSNSVICAIDAALEDLSLGNNYDIPSTMKDGHYAGAKVLNKSAE